MSQETTLEKSRITIHRALSELKLIDAKITKQIGSIDPCGVKQGTKLVNNHIKDEDFNTSAKSKFTSIIDLITRKGLIKSAIVKANGETKVTVAGKQMTIADAINTKQAITFKKSLIAALQIKHQQAVGVMNKNNELVAQNLQRLLEASFGKDVKTDSNEVEAIMKPYISANEFNLVDPLDAKARIEELQNEVDKFEAEVDAVLSEINAVTFIEI